MYERQGVSYFWGAYFSSRDGVPRAKKGLYIVVSVIKEAIIS